MLSKAHHFPVGVSCSAGLYEYSEVCIWLGALKSTITSILPFSSTLWFPFEQEKAKCHPKSLVSPALVKPYIPGATSAHHVSFLPQISAVSSSVLVRPFSVTINTGSVLAVFLSTKKQTLWRGCFSLCWANSSSLHRNEVWWTYDNSLFHFRVCWFGFFCCVLVCFFFFPNEFSWTKLQHVFC